MVIGKNGKEVNGMEQKTYIPQCSCCGASGASTKTGTRPPAYSPSAMSIGGKCKNSPDQKHKPKWVEQH